MIRRMLATMVGMGLLAGLSNLPWGRAERSALIRLSWRTTGQQVKVAKVQDPNLPTHMRLPESQAFELKIRPYRLSVQLDQHTALERAVLAPGFRHDRPLTVFQEFSVTPGDHRLEVTFQAQPLEGSAPPLTARPFAAELACQAGQVYLVSLDESGQWIYYFERANP
ncbi:hypothetical protein JST97_33230 [bacterium]|nr:hypothetical protein [bacterium]